MNIAVIGTGNVGGALARKWARAGHNIVLAVRDINSFKGKELLEEANITVLPVAQAMVTTDVVLIAAIPQATAEIVSSMGNVNGKVVIDAMNSVRTKPEGFNNSFDALKALTTGADVVKCFNSVGYNVMANTDFNGITADMYMAGSSPKAKEVAKQLALDAGFENCYDFGGDDKVALLEQFALCWINLAMMQGQGREMMFKLTKR
ncbi:MAG: NAD(P)-binding domain-containing protein [Chitinophagales bacterium]|nr:NAD(P)-binding domain-containing protein [Chitinophagales bacterium]